MTEREESEGFYEMLWDCDHCSAKGLLASSQRHCGECGAPQNPDKRYFPPPGQETRIAGYQYVGADRTCSACSAPMGASAKNCTQCGAPLDGSTEVREVRGVEPPVPSAAKPAPSKRRRVWLYVLVAMLAIGLAAWWLFIRAHVATVTVVAHRWQRTIEIDELGPHSQSAWRDQVPVSAALPLCQRKQRSSRQVQDGETCHTERHDKRDGTFEQVKKCAPKYRSEPIDDDWCTFTAVSWQKIDEVESSGTGLSPEWPAQTLPPATTPPALGARRYGARADTLVLDFGEAGTCDVPEATWRKYADAQTVRVDVRARSGGVVCDSL